MVSSFPSPILSVAADVVRDLDGEDALFGLWARAYLFSLALSFFSPSPFVVVVFTKCKESLKDGRRLENISWRLWYREMASAQSTPSTSPGSLSPSFSEKRSPSPITPVSEDGLVAQQGQYFLFLSSSGSPSFCLLCIYPALFPPSSRHFSCAHCFCARHFLRQNRCFICR